MAQAKELAEVLRSAADGLRGQRRRVPVALTAVGSELPVEDLLAAAQLASDEILRKRMGNSGRQYLEEHFDVRNSAEIILRHFSND